MRAKCPTCGGSITAIVARGPSTHAIHPCGHDVGPLTARDLAGDEDASDMRGQLIADGGHEHVIVRQRTNWGSTKIYHDPHPERPEEPSCSKQQKTDVEWRRQDPTALTDTWRKCRYCAGTADHGGSTAPHALRNRLEDAEPEELGLAPIGEREGDLVTDGGCEEPEKPITERVAEGGQYGDPLEDSERPVPDDGGSALEVDE